MAADGQKPEPANDGQKPEPANAETLKDLRTKLAEFRKSCEALAGFGFATVIGNILRSPPADPWQRRIPLGLAAIQITLSLVGLSHRGRLVNSAHEETTLIKTLNFRRWCRNLSLVLLVATVIYMLLHIW